MKLKSLYSATINEEGEVEAAIDQAIQDGGYTSQADAAKAMGIANSTLSRWKHLGSPGKNSKKRSPSIKALAAAADTLGAGAVNAIYRAAKSEVTGNKPKGQRSKARHGSRTKSTKAMRQAQEDE